VNIPPELVDVIRRSRYGDQTRERYDIEVRAELMEYSYARYLKAQAKIRALEVEWGERRIEDFYGEPLWYNAHRRLAAWEKKLKTAASEMFRILTETDGVQAGVYDSFFCLSPEDMMSRWRRNYGGLARREVKA